MTDIDELIESWKAFLAIACSGKPGDESWIKLPIEKTITALQEMRFQIASLETVVNVKKQRIAGLSYDLKSYAAMHVEQESEIGRLSDKFDVAVEKGSPVVLDWETTKHIIELLEGLNND